MTIPIWARKGAKVVCISRDPEPRKRFTAEPPPMDVPLTVIGNWLREDGVVCLRIAGFPNYGRGSFDRGWILPRFRPVLDLKDDAEVEMALYYKKGLHQSVPRKKSVDA